MIYCKDCPFSVKFEARVIQKNSMRLGLEFPKVDISQQMENMTPSGASSQQMDSHLTTKAPKFGMHFQAKGTQFGKFPIQLGLQDPKSVGKFLNHGLNLEAIFAPAFSANEKIHDDVLFCVWCIQVAHRTTRTSTRMFQAQEPFYFLTSIPIQPVEPCEVEGQDPLVTQTSQGLSSETGPKGLSMGGFDEKKSIKQIPPCQECEWGGFCLQCFIQYILIDQMGQEILHHLLQASQPGVLPKEKSIKDAQGHSPNQARGQSPKKGSGHPFFFPFPAINTNEMNGNESLGFINEKLWGKAKQPQTKALRLMEKLKKNRTIPPLHAMRRTHLHLLELSINVW